MKMHLVVLAILTSNLSLAQVPADTSRIVQWQQEGAWDAILNTVRGVSNPGPRLLDAAGFAAFQSGDRVGALRWYEQSLAADSGSRSALYYSALILKLDERAQLALPLLLRLCRLAPGNATYQQLLGDCYSETDQDPAAADAYRRALRLAPGSIALVTKLAASLQASKLPEQADTLLRTAMLQHPGTPVLINSAILLAYGRKQYARCATLCDSLIATGRLNYRSLLSGLYADIARPDFRHATQLGEVLIAMDAGTEEVLYYKAIAHQRLGEWKTADTLLQQCVRKALKPELKASYIALAEGAEAAGAYLKSKAYYDTAYYLFKSPEILYRSGRMLEAHGLGAQAKPVYMRYLSLPRGRQDTAVSRYMKERLGTGEPR